MNTSAARLPTVALLATLATIASVSTVLAQEPTSIVGTVLDESTFAPIQAGHVQIVELGRETWTDQNGGFVLTDVPVGRFTIRVSLSGYSTAVDQIDVTDGEVAFVQVYVLPVAALLDEVMVLSGRSPTNWGTEVAGGKREMAITAADLLQQQVPGLNMGRGSGVGGGSRVIIRGVKSFVGNNTPTIYLDGVRISHSPTASMPPNDAPKLAVLDDMPASQVKRIRVLKGASAAAQYADSANGVILIETYRGERE